MSSPPVRLRWACADGFGRVRGLRARSATAGFLGLAASIFCLFGSGLARAQFPIRQIPANRLPQGQQAVQSGMPQGADASRSPASGHKPHPAIARIVVQERDAISYGSGTLIDARGQFGLVITNWHVVRDAAGQITAEFPDGSRLPAQVVKTDKDWDLAALSIARPKADPLPVSPSAPQPGQWLTIAGYGSGEFRAASGRCTQYVSPGEEFPYEMLELSAEARQGDSGGPIVNERGELCGVLFGSGRGYTSGSYGGRVLNFLASVVPGGQPGNDAALPANSVALKPPADASSPPGEAEPAIRQWTALHGPQPTTIPLQHVPPHLAHTHEAGPLTPAGTPEVDQILKVPATTPPADDVDPRAAVDHLTANLGGLNSRNVDALQPLDPAARPLGSLPPRTPAAAEQGNPLDRASSDQLLAAAWKRIGGSTLVDQGKTVLALVGVLFVMIQVWRISSRKEPEVVEDE